MQVFGYQTFNKNGHSHTCKRPRYQLNEFHPTISSEPHPFPLFYLTISFVSPYQACSTISRVVFSTHHPPPNSTFTSNSSSYFFSMHSYFQPMYFLSLFSSSYPVTLLLLSSGQKHPNATYNSCYY